MKKKSRTVPMALKDKYEEITAVLKNFCEEKINEEYYELSCDLCAAIGRKRPSPLLSGKAGTWACGIIHALGTVNFLFDSTQIPYLSAKELYESFGISSSTAIAKSKQIRDSFKMSQFDPDWTLPSKIEDNPLVWMILVNGLAIDARTAPRDIQEAAFQQGIIPYIPEASEEKKKDNKVIQFPGNKKAYREKSEKENLAEAETLIYEAYETDISRRKIELARKALKLSENCAEAYIILAEEYAEDIEEEKEFYEKALEAARKAIGEKIFEEEVGFFWMIPETRPYLRAKWYLAETLWYMDRRKEAIEHLKDMIRLNKDDNQGVRYILINWLLEEEDYEYLEQLFKENKDDGSAALKYSEALFYFKKGNKEVAAQKLRAALKTNPHVPKYLLGMKKLPIEMPEYIGRGDETEAQAYVAEAFEVWGNTKGALDWIGDAYKR